MTRTELGPALFTGGFAIPGQVDDNLKFTFPHFEYKSLSDFVKLKLEMTGELIHFIAPCSLKCNPYPVVKAGKQFF